MTRTKALVGAIFVVTLAAGCLIKGPDPQPAYYSNIRIFPNSNSRPPLGLEPAPAGRIYQLWFIDWVSAPGATIMDYKTTPLKRFQWNSEYFFAVSDSGETLGITSDRGLDLGENVLDHMAMALSIEPLNDPHPNSIDGPIIMAGFRSPLTKDNLVINMSLTPNRTILSGIIFENAQQSACWYALYSPSYTKRPAGQCWRDSSEGLGIWFATPTVKDRSHNDTVALCMADKCPQPPGAALDTCRSHACGSGPQARGTHFGIKYVQGKRNARGPGYHLWIFPSHPESSFCNFDTIFANQEPDLIFRDGVPEHLGGNVGPQMRLGEHPIIRNNETVGYMYFRTDTTGLVDTCFLRVDFPESTHCVSDTFKAAPFNDTSVIVRSYLTTWAETTYTSTLNTLAQPPDSVFGGAQFMKNFLGLQYEAWVIIDSSTGPIKPISLGRFTNKNERDEGNTHFSVQNISSGLHFPGEDFLQGIDRPGLPSTDLNLLSLLSRHRVKIWITLEPVNNDWALDEPNRQLILYSGELAPDLSMGDFRPICERRGIGGTGAPPVYTRQLTYEEVSATSAGLNEGHNLPYMQIAIRPPQK